MGTTKWHVCCYIFLPYLWRSSIWTKSCEMWNSSQHRLATRYSIGYELDSYFLDCNTVLTWWTVSGACAMACNWRVDIDYGGSTFAPNYGSVAMHCVLTWPVGISITKATDSLLAQPVWQAYACRKVCSRRPWSKCLQIGLCKETVKESKCTPLGLAGDCEIV